MATDIKATKAESYKQALRAIVDLTKLHKKTSDGTLCFGEALEIAKAALKR